MKKRITNKFKFSNAVKKIKIRNIIVFLLVIIFIGTKMLFNHFDQKIMPIFLEYAEVEASKMASIIINQSVTSDIKKKFNHENLFIMNKNNNEEIMTFDFNSENINYILLEITKNIQTYYKNLEEGKIDLIPFFKDKEYSYNISNLKKGIIYEIPTGIAFNNILLRNVGPKIPVKVNLRGNVISNVNTKISNYGINNALLEIFINIEVNQLVLLPMIKKDISVKTKIPLAIKIIQGKVPDYYLNGIDKNSLSLSIPNVPN